MTWITKDDILNLRYYLKNGNLLLLPSNSFKSLDIFPGNFVGNPVENFALDARIIVRIAKNNAVDFFILFVDYFCLSTGQQ